MAVKIRLARFGRNKTPFYHVVVTDSRNRRDSKFLEKIGTFNPLLSDDNKDKLVLKNERAEYWLGVGAQPSERVALLMIKAKVNGAEKYKPVFVPKAKVVKEEPKVEEPKAEEVKTEDVKVEESAPVVEESKTETPAE